MVVIPYALVALCEELGCEISMAKCSRCAALQPLVFELMRLEGLAGITDHVFGQSGIQCALVECYSSDAGIQATCLCRTRRQFFQDKHQQFPFERLHREFASRLLNNARFPSSTHTCMVKFFLAGPFIFICIVYTYLSIIYLFNY